MGMGRKINVCSFWPNNGWPKMRERPHFGGEGIFILLFGKGKIGIEWEWEGNGTILIYCPKGVNKWRSGIWWGEEDSNEENGPMNEMCFGLFSGIFWGFIWYKEFEDEGGKREFGRIKLGEN